MFIVKPFNLQLFADETDVPQEQTAPDAKENAPEEEKREKTFTQAELDRIVKERLKRVEKRTKKDRGGLDRSAKACKDERRTKKAV